MSTSKAPTAAAIASGDPKAHHALAGYLLDSGFIKPETVSTTWSLSSALSDLQRSAGLTLTGLYDEATEEFVNKPNPSNAIPAAGDPNLKWNVIYADIQDAQIVAAGHQVFMRLDTGHIFQYQGTAQSWWKIDSNTLAVEIAANNETVFQRRSNGDVLHYSKTKENWTLLETGHDPIGIAAAGTNLYLIQNGGNIYKWDTHWQLIDGNPANVQIIGSGDNLYKRHSDWTIDHYNGTGWISISSIPSTTTTKFVCGGGQVYQLQLTGHVFKYTGSDTEWTQIDGNPSTNDIAAGGDELYQRHYDGSIYRWMGNTWKRLGNGGVDATLIVSDSGALYRISEGKTFALVE